MNQMRIFVVLCVLLVGSVKGQQRTLIGGWREGRATHYGPWPSFPAYSEPGFQPNDVGVACSTGVPGGDPKWKEILLEGLHPRPKLDVNKNTVWPVRHVVAVSQAVYSKAAACWKEVTIRNKKTGNYITATIVDFCPAQGCNWQGSERANNVDIYGEAAWRELGGDLTGGVMEVQVLWPAMTAQSSSPPTLRSSFSFVIITASLVGIAIVF